MTTEPVPPLSERMKTYLWYGAIGLLLIGAVVLWLRPPQPTVKSKSVFTDDPIDPDLARRVRKQRQLEEAGRLLQSENAEVRREALTRIQAIVTEAPDFYGARQMLVTAAMANDEPDLAEQAAREIVGMHPDLPDGHVTLGRVLQAARGGAGAVEAFEKAIELFRQQEQPVHWSIYGMLAEAYLVRGDVDAADANLRRAADTNLTDATAFIAQRSLDLSERLGRVLVVSNNEHELQAAFVLLRGVAQNKPDDAEAQSFAARAALKRKNIDAARVFVAKAEQLQPDDPQVAALKAEIEAAPTTQAATAPATRAAESPAGP
ncbi:MAG: tetratricopeptide repeat protein [Phycisphaerae bacterium]|nr:tetratricopeptide repeat protein [Phycisphaerae bacterium]